MSIRVNLKQMKAMLMRKSLYEFIKEFWDQYETAEFCDHWLIEWMCECYQYSIKHFLPNYIWKDWISDEEYNHIRAKTGGICPVRDTEFDGKKTRNHDWNMPPRHMKSTIINVCGPVWTVINTPLKVASVSHSERLSTDMNAKRQKILKGPKYRYYFADSDPGLNTTTCTASSIKLWNGSELYAVPMASFTGFGADVIINDDLISADHARKDMQVLKNAVDFFRKTMPSRLNSKSTGVIWQVQQRLGNGDISGVIAGDKELAKVYSHTELQAISSKEVTFIYPCSGKTKTLSVGECLWPERFGDYTSMKIEMGRDEFETQYNQDPAFSTTNIVKDRHIHFIEDDELKDFKSSAEFNYGSHDCPVKDKKTSDLHGFCGGYGKGADLVIDRSWAEHLAYVKEKQLIKDYNMLDPSIIQIIEDKANGAPLLQDLRGEVSGLIGFQPGSESKTQRLERAVPYMEAGQVRFARNEETAKLIAKLKKFPLVQNDDDVDAFTQLVLYHNTGRMVGVYTGAFSYENQIDFVQRRPGEYVFYEYAATVVGDTFKVIQCSKDEMLDEFYIENEWEFKGIDTFTRFVEEHTIDGNFFLDASIKNVISSIIFNVGYITKYTENDRDKSISLMKSGLYNKKIKICKHCTKTISDIAKLRFTEQSMQQGQERLQPMDEGFAGCVRALVTYDKGYANIWY